MAYSNVGKTRLKVYFALYAVNIIVLAVAARVNQFQSFFFIADLFPLGLSIATLVVLSLMLFLDFTLANPFTSRPPFEIGFLVVMSILWLSFNAFSTSRWRHVPYTCAAAGNQAQRDWCRNLHTLKAFVWVEWVILLLTTVFTTRFALREHKHGRTHIWRTALSRYSPTSDKIGDANAPYSRTSAPSFVTPAPDTDFAYAFAAPTTAYGNSGNNSNQYSTYGDVFGNDMTQSANGGTNNVGLQHQRTTSTSIFTGVSSGGVHQRTQSQAHATYGGSNFDYGAGAAAVVGGSGY